jgi:hypothetical protein
VNPIIGALQVVEYKTNTYLKNVRDAREMLKLIKSETRKDLKATVCGR